MSSTVGSLMHCHRHSERTDADGVIRAGPREYPFFARRIRAPERGQAADRGGRGQGEGTGGSGGAGGGGGGSIQRQTKAGRAKATHICAESRYKRWLCGSILLMPKTELGTWRTRRRAKLHRELDRQRIGCQGSGSQRLTVGG